VLLGDNAFREEKALFGDTCVLLGEETLHSGSVGGGGINVSGGTVSGGGGGTVSGGGGGTVFLGDNVFRKETALFGDICVLLGEIFVHLGDMETLHSSSESGGGNNSYVGGGSKVVSSSFGSDRTICLFGSWL
jgi:hypothetical protein